MQEVDCGACLCAPPISVCTKNNTYRVIERKSG
jgi:hypothetical protein